MTTGQQAITTSRAKIVSGNNQREVLVLSVTADIYLGDSAVTAETGLLVKAGIPHYLQEKGDLYGITAADDAVATFFDQNYQ